MNTKSKLIAKKKTPIACPKCGALVKEIAEYSKYWHIPKGLSCPNCQCTLIDVYRGGSDAAMAAKSGG